MFDFRLYIFLVLISVGVSSFAVSLLSWIPNDISENEVVRPPFAIFDQNFAVGLGNEDLVHPASQVTVGLRSGGYYRPWRHHATRHSGTSNIIYGKEGFKVNLDMQQFLLDEIIVKTKGQYVTVEGRHKERQDEHGFVSRSFKRRYLLPDNVDLEQVTSCLSSDGILTVYAPRIKSVNTETESLIPVTVQQKLVEPLMTCDKVNSNMIL